MGLTGQSFRPAKQKRGPRISATAQLGPVARRLVLALWWESRRLKILGTPDEQVQVHNNGVVWNVQQMSELIGALPASTSRALGVLEDRGLICCWAKGTGNNRRVQYVKLSAQAIEVARKEEAQPGEKETAFKQRLVRQFFGDDENFKMYFLEQALELGVKIPNIVKPAP